VERAYQTFERGIDAIVEKVERGAGCMTESREVEPPNGWGWSTIGEVTEATIEQKAPEGQGDFLYIDI
jgi:hypothetical protein